MTNSEKMLLQVLLLCFSLLIQSTYSGSCLSWGNPIGFLWRNCQCTPKPNFSGLRKSFDENLFGQHLVKDTVLNGLEAHFKNPNPSRAKVFLFSGAYGTGKNFAAEMIANYYFPDEQERKNFVLFLKPTTFTINQVEEDIKVLRYRLMTMVTYDCDRAIIIFDEIEKAPREVIRSLVHFVSNENPDPGANYHKLTFILLANEAMSAIRNKTKEHHKVNGLRKYLTLVDFEHLIRAELTAKLGNFLSHETALSGAENDEIVRRGFISAYVPFMPLERGHIEQCIHAYEKQLKMNFDAEFVKSVLSQISFDEDDLIPVKERNKNRGLYSTDGCRNVKEKVDVQINRGVFHGEL